MAIITKTGGVKLQHRLVEANYLKTPSILQAIIPKQPEFYEAYLYLIKDTITGKKYLGIHSLSDKTYFTSATDIELKRMIQGSEKRLIYKILEYGFLSEIRTKENYLLSQINAANSDMWFNKQNGFKAVETIDWNAVRNLVKLIESKKWQSVQKESISELINIPTFQIRTVQYDTNHLKRITHRIKAKSGNTDVANPIVILSNRLNNVLYEITDLRIDGAHTLQGAISAGSTDIHTIRVPEEYHSKLNNSEIDAVASLLNREPEVIKLPNTKKDATDWIVRRYAITRNPYNHPEHIEYLQQMGFTKPEQNSILKKAKELIIQYDQEMHNNTSLIDYKGASKKVLKSKADDLKDNKTIVISMSTSSIRFDRILEKIQDDVQKRKNVHVLFFHSSYEAASKYDYTLSLLKKRLKYWAKGIKFKFTLMPHTMPKLNIE